MSLQIFYSPPAGVVGAAVAKLFGRDAESELDEDLFILKALLETGRMPEKREIKRSSEVVRSVE